MTTSVFLFLQFNLINMGLCKCPKRKVTNLFCFEHRVNVCEHCMVSNHPKCIIQSYCQWLKDSDYSSLCGTCNTELAQEECLRLICYHVFHIKCLDEYCRQYPANTAPAGFVCPTCSSPIFPAANLVSPVADNLRAAISKRAWAREGLGLPLLAVDSAASAELAVDAEGPKTKINEVVKQGPPYSIIDVDSPSAFHRSELLAPARRPTVGLLSGKDHDENKYKRRPPWEAFKRLLSNMLAANPRYRKDSKFGRRHVALAVVGFFVVLFLFAVSSRVLNGGPDDASPVNAPYHRPVDEIN